MVRIIVVENYKEMSSKAANIVVSTVTANRQVTLGLATGETPLGMYRELINYYKEGGVDFNHVITFNLDEYIGLSSRHPQSFAYYMKENFFDHVNVPKDKTFIPSGVKKGNLKQACTEYDELLKRHGPIDLQILGIGTNGHIGFNEPNSVLKVNTHIVNLSEETIRANAHYFKKMEDVPRRAITMGMGGIMKAKSILLLAKGKEKAEAIFKALNGVVDPNVPASFLQLHPRVTFIIDRGAASLLMLKNSLIHVPKGGDRDCHVKSTFKIALLKLN